LENNALSFALWIGITLATFRQSGTTPVSMDLLISMYNGASISHLICFSSQLDILLLSRLLLFFIDAITSFISSHEVGYKKILLGLCGPDLHKYSKNVCFGFGIFLESSFPTSEK
jgi:hypothetical protein